MSEWTALKDSGLIDLFVRMRDQFAVPSYDENDSDAKIVAATCAVVAVTDEIVEKLIKPELDNIRWHMTLKARLACLRLIETLVLKHTQCDGDDPAGLWIRDQVEQSVSAIWEAWLAIAQQGALDHARKDRTDRQRAGRVFEVTERHHDGNRRNVEAMSNADRQGIVEQVPRESAYMAGQWP